MTEHATSTEIQHARRIVFFDALRGFTIISMVLFHACYDLAYLYAVPMPWFSGTIFQTIWRASISWTFLVLAGWMTSLSRNNLKRGFLYGVAAFLVFGATSVASVDTAVSFGILYCMSACTLLWCAAERALKHIDARLLIILFLVLFVATYTVPQGRYEVECLAWLGFPSTSFSSGDYYPLLPYCFLYLIGACAARWHRERVATYPTWMYVNRIPPLAFIGRHSLVIYLAHQPILLLVLSILFN